MWIDCGLALQRLLECILEQHAHRQLLKEKKGQRQVVEAYETHKQADTEDEYCFEGSGTETRLLYSYLDHQV